MATEKLYDQNAYLRRFDAVCVDCRAGKGGYEVRLNRTAFYPEGGGQGADRGTIASAKVLDVQEGAEGEIIHLCDAAVEPGREVSCEIDWARRFDHMQQHSGEHILSGILCQCCHCDNVGFHMGADTVTIDYNTDISWEQALAAERRANEIIWENRETEITLPDANALSQLAYRSKKALTGQVRIVTFPGADCCACCGTHVARAGEVGLVKVLSVQKFREGVRMEILCGQRAMDFLSRVYEQNRAVGQQLSVKALDTAAAVERLAAEAAEEKHRAAGLETQLFESIAAAYQSAGDTLLLQPPMKSDSVRRLGDAVAKRCGGLAAVFSGADGAGYAYALLRSDGSDLSPLVKELNQALHGRGGGRGGFAQGSVQCAADEIRAFFNR